MTQIIVIRPYQPSDDADCKALLRNAVSSTCGTAFFTMMFNEITFQLMILFTAIMFIFIGLPLPVCVLVIPMVIILMYLGTYASIALKIARIQQENITRTYMSNSFSCFWIAEAYQSCLEEDPRNLPFTILTEQEFQQLDLGFSLQPRKIVATVGLCKSYFLDEGAWLKRLCIHHSYRKSGVDEFILRTAIEFAVKQGYRFVNTQVPRYDHENKQMCLEWGFEFKQMHHKRIVGSFITLLMYELAYRTNQYHLRQPRYIKVDTMEPWHKQYNGKTALNLY